MKKTHTPKTSCMVENVVVVDVSFVFLCHKTSEKKVVMTHVERRKLYTVRKSQKCPRVI